MNRISRYIPSLDPPAVEDIDERLDAIPLLPPDLSIDDAIGALEELAEEINHYVHRGDPNPPITLHDCSLRARVIAGALRLIRDTRGVP